MNPGYPTLNSLDTVVDLRKHSATDKTTDFKAILTTIKAKNPDYVFWGGMDDTAAILAKQLKELGLKSEEQAKMAESAAQSALDAANTVAHARKPLTTRPRASATASTAPCAYRYARPVLISAMSICKYVYIFFIRSGFILYISYNFHFLIFRHVYILTIIFGFVHIFIGIFQKNKLYFIYSIGTIIWNTLIFFIYHHLRKYNIYVLKINKKYQCKNIYSIDILGIKNMIYNKNEIFFNLLFYFWRK